MSESKRATLTLEMLGTWVSGHAVAIRGRAELQPAGHPGDKVFPPTHSVDERRESSRYALEMRRIGGEQVACVLLDSVQSQANRMEEALQALWADKRITLPVITVDFSESAADVGVVTSLTAPHRIADALLRDSLTKDGEFFRLSALGRSFTDASSRNAASLFKVCPTGLVFGLWDSTGPKGGLGAKFARALVSEIVGVDITPGVKTASRIDPTGIITKAAEIFVAADPSDGWTHDPKLAKTDKGKPVVHEGGKVSEVNHSNVPPTIDRLAGGVTMDRAEHTAVLSLAALRKLHFGGNNNAARTVLAALGLLAVLASESRGHDLRSRCLLVPKPGKALALEAVSGDGSIQEFAVDLVEMIRIYEAAVAQLPEALAFKTPPGAPIAELTPSEKLAYLVTRSRQLAGQGAGADDEAD